MLPRRHRAKPSRGQEISLDTPLLALGALDVLDRLGLSGGGCCEDAGAMWTASISSSVSPTTHTPPRKDQKEAWQKGQLVQSQGENKL